MSDALKTSRLSIWATDAEKAEIHRAIALREGREDVSGKAPEDYEGTLLAAICAEWRANENAKIKAANKPA